jgi:hypothetical protein
LTDCVICALPIAKICIKYDETIGVPFSSASWSDDGLNSTVVASTTVWPVTVVERKRRPTTVSAARVAPRRHMSRFKNILCLVPLLVRGARGADCTNCAAPGALRQVLQWQ